jgi:hypothetical protein
MRDSHSRVLMRDRFAAMASVKFGHPRRGNTLSRPFASEHYVMLLHPMLLGCCIEQSKAQHPEKLLPTTSQDLQRP